MDFNKNAKQPVINTGRIIKRSFWATFKDPQILFYPFAAVIFISVSGTIIGSSIFGRWYNQIFAEASAVVPHRVAIIAGLVSFTVFYAALISAYFNVAVAASVLAKLEGHSTELFYGLRQVVKHFWRVSHFALFSPFMLPVGIFVQHRKLPKGLVNVIGSSLSLNMSQIAPEILNTKKSFSQTIVDAIETLGRKWREGLIIKIGLYLAFGLIIVLPKLIQSGFFSGTPSADKIGWLASLIAGASSYVFFKVLSSIITATLYHHAKQTN